MAVLIVSSLLILNFDNPGIGQISFLASLDLVIEQMSVGQVFSVTQLAFERTTFFFDFDVSFWDSNDSIFSCARWDVLLKLFPIFKFASAVNASWCMSSNVLVEFVF